MRSSKEILFRIRQELANLALYAFPSGVSSHTPSPLPYLPDPHPVAARLAHSNFAKQVERVARMVAAGRFPLLGRESEYGQKISWRRDPDSGKESGPLYFRRIPYLNAAIVGDHKFIWELNRHQYLVAIAQMHLFSGETQWVRLIERIIEDWDRENPFQRGINWASALEVAFRALSWIWVYHFAGSSMSEAGRERLLRGIYRHALHLEYNLSIYFSPNTHLLGEAVALHAIGRLFPDFPHARRWEELGARITREQMDRQVEDDGSHFEKSTYYHVYALDFFLLHHILSGGDTGYQEKLARMAHFLAAICGRERVLPMLGDDDGGRLFHPYEQPERIGRATLATCGEVLQSNEWAYDATDTNSQAAWWLGERVGGISCPGRPLAGFSSFPQAGLIIHKRGGLHVLFDAGGMGSGSGGHSHADALSIVVRLDGEALLTDRGTFTYVGDPAAREWFRGTTAHNTVSVDGSNQATPEGPFRWRNNPTVKAIRASGGWSEAICETESYTHRRRMLVLDTAFIVVIDEVDTSTQMISTFWHPRMEPEAITGTAFRIGAKARLLLSHRARLEASWHSQSYGSKERSWTIVAQCVAGEIMAAIIDLNGVLESAPVTVRRNGPSLVVEVGTWHVDLPA